MIPPDIASAITVALPAGQTLDGVFAARARRPFAPETIAFIEELGRSLRADPGSRRFPELVALGFWARGASIQRLKNRFEAAYPGAARSPRGVAFHVAPSNVDTIFVYSLLLSMLAGNVNLVRVSSRSGEQAGHLMGLLARALEAAGPGIRDSVAIMRTPHDKPVIDWLSAHSGIRIVWGGDETVSRIRQSQLAPGGTELVFPNRVSLAVVDAAAWLAEADKPVVARRFVNDSLWFGQMACSSPGALVWRGTAGDVDAASASFWPEVDRAAGAADLEWADASAVAKLLAAQDLAAGANIRVVPQRDNRVTVVRPTALEGLGRDNPTGAGFFREYRIDSLAELTPFVRRNWQTVVSHGIARGEWEAWIADDAPAGIDRIVKMGEALDFDAIWDGVDLLSAMTRIVAIHA